MIIKQFICIVCLLILFCAKTGFPPGGPDDTLPPEVIETTPENGALHVSQDTDVEIVFNEHIRAGAAEEAVFISPFPGEDVKYQWKGKKLKIVFPDTLKPNRSYVITVGTRIKDLRNNPLPETYVLAFSTGDRLDKAGIHGLVEAERSAQGIGVWAYILTDSTDPNPSDVMPDYETQCDAKGQFQFFNLAPGTYRLFAVQDRLGDHLYQPGEDAIGIPVEDIYLSASDTAFGPVFFRTFVEDTLQPTLQRVRVNHSRHVIARFDEAMMEIFGNARSCFRITEKEDSTTALAVENAFQDAQKAMFHLYTDTMKADIYYLLHASGLVDPFGNSLDSLYATMVFQGVSTPDTTAPVLVSVSPLHRQQHVGLDTPVEIVFSEAMDSVSLESALSLSDTSGALYSGFYEWLNPANVLFYPDEFLKSETEYRIRIDSLAAMDLCGNFLADSTIVYTTVNQDTFASISGVLLDPAAASEGSLVIRARSLNSAKTVYEVLLMEPGPYVISDVLPGKYVLSAFRDRNEDGLYSYGQVYPFVPSERFTVYSDTVFTKSRWTSEENDFSLP